jgi:cellulose synthase (UDP-forming)
VSSMHRAYLILPLWFLAAIWLWSWWLESSVSANPFLYVPLTLAVAYEYLLVPSVFLGSLLLAKAPKKRKPLKNAKVAVITPCVPAQESSKIIERQLAAMAAITYPHDSWILDEGGRKEIKQLARKYGVKYFTRKDKSKYNLDTYPFKAKSKAGNINAWLHSVRGRNYDFFVQLDIDHVPNPDYLDKTLGHFRDKNVAWVQAPSVYGNLEFWTARGATEQDMGLHGPMQMAFYKANETPVIIGSHTTFRRKAIDEIGGFQPTRAEDHLNTLALSNKGWKGVFLPEIIAVGDGPETLNAYLSQQYAWAFSMTQILKTYSRQYLKKMGIKKRLQFTFLLTWYPLSALAFLTMFFVPLLGLLFNTYAFASDGTDFVTRFAPAFAGFMLMLWAGKPLLQPQNTGMSWRGILLHAIRWPVILLAVTSAAIGRVKPYQITPKGKFLRNVPTAKLYMPFLVLSFVSAITMLVSAMYYSDKAADGLLIFAISNLSIMLGVCLLDLNMRIRSMKINLRTLRKSWAQPVMAVSSILLMASVAIIVTIRENQQVIYALIPETAVQSKQVEKDLASIPPALLTMDELKKEITAAHYPHVTGEPPKVGMHSPTSPPTSLHPYIRHSFADWREDHKVARELLTTLRAGNTPFITIEPKGELDGAKLLSDISAGAHDDTINSFLDVVGLTPNDVYLRFGHEMDLAGVYPWGAQDGSAYIKAYRHVVELAQAKHIDNIKWVWGPGGVMGADVYYPGDDVVDVIGTTVLHDQTWNGNTRLPFYEFVRNRMWLQKYGKPVWITEFGAGNKDKEFQRQLITDAVNTYQGYGFAALIYINIPDSNIPGPDYSFDDPSELMQLLDPAPIQKPLPNKPENKPMKQLVNIYNAKQNQQMQQIPLFQKNRVILEQINSEF